MQVQALSRLIGLMGVVIGLVQVVWAETVPWKVATVIRIEQDTPPSWLVTVASEDDLIVLKPYRKYTGVLGSIVDTLRLGRTGEKFDYARPSGVIVGASIKVALFSNGQADIQVPNGQIYGAEVLSQTLVIDSPIPQRTNPPPISAQVSMASETDSDTPSDYPWRMMESPNLGWRFTLREQFVFGEAAIPNGRVSGNYFTIDATRKGNRYEGTVRIRLSSPKECEWVLVVVLTTVTTERIDGHLKASEIQPVPCGVPVQQSEKVTWIRDGLPEVSADFRGLTTTALDPKPEPPSPGTLEGTELSGLAAKTSSPAVTLVPPQLDVPLLAEGDERTATQSVHYEPRFEGSGFVFALQDPIGAIPIASRRPEFQVRESGSFGWTMHLELRRVTAKGGSRRISRAQTAEANIPITIKSVDDTLYSIRVNDTLRPGEYALVTEDSNRAFLFEVR